MFSYNKKVRMKPYESIPLADFEVQPDAPPLRMMIRPGKVFHSHSRADLAHDFGREKHAVAPMKLRRPKSAMELSGETSRSSGFRMGTSVSDDVQDEIAESSRELIECLPKMTAVKVEKPDSDKKKESLSLDSPATATRDCMMVFPQNTVPMAKYRKKIVGELPDSDDEEAPMTDAQRWSKEKMLEDKGKSKSKFHAGADQIIVRNKRRKPTLWASPPEEKVESLDLKDQINKPTYMDDSCMEGEGLLSAITKGQPRRRSLAAISNVVAKLTKRRPSEKEAAEDDFDFGDNESIGPKKATVVTFAEPEVQEENRTRSQNSAQLSADEFNEAVNAPPPSQYMDTKEIISYSESLVSKISNDRRTPENALDFPIPNSPIPTPVAFTLPTIPEVERSPVVSQLSDAPIFIRPPETPFEKSDDVTSEDDRGRRPRRHSSKSSHRRYRASRSANGDNSGDHDDTEADKESLLRKHRESKRRQSSRKHTDSKNRVAKRKSTRKSRRRGSDVREKVGLEHLDRAKKDNRNSDDSDEIPSSAFAKFSTFIESEVNRLVGNESKSTNISKSESFALQSFARKLVNMVQQNTESLNPESANDSDAALLQKDTIAINHNTGLVEPLQNGESFRTRIASNTTETNQDQHIIPVRQTSFTTKKNELERSIDLHPPASTVTVVKPDDLSTLPDLSSGEALKTIVRLPTLKEQPDETEKSLRKRVEDFLNGDTEEGYSQFQRVPGRRWVAEWARREPIIPPQTPHNNQVTNPNNSENVKVKRKRSSLLRKRSIKRNPSTSSIGTFFGKIFGRFRLDSEPTDVKETEVVACVYSTSVNDKINRDDVAHIKPTSFSDDINRDDVTCPLTSSSRNPNPPENVDKVSKLTAPENSVRKVTFLDGKAQSKDSGVFSDKGVDSVDEIGKTSRSLYTRLLAKN